MLRTALRNVLAHKARLLMTVLAVMLGVAFVSGTLVFTDTLGNAFRNQSAKSYDNVAVAVTTYATKGDEEFSAIDSATLSRIQDLDGVAHAAGRVSGFAGVADPDGKLIGNGWTNTGSNFSPGTNGKDEQYAFTDGTGPARADQVALDKDTAVRGEYRVGEKVRVAMNGPVKEYTLSGVFTTEDGSVNAGGSLVLFDTQVAQQLYLRPGEFQEVTITAAAGASDRQLVDAVKPLLPKDAEARTGAVLAEEQAEQTEAGLKNLNQILLVFAGIALFVGIFLITNTFTMLVAQRTRELALMRAVGASRRQVKRAVLLEAGVVGAVASVIGFVLGLGLAVGLRSAMGMFGGKIPAGPLIVSPTAVASAFGVGVLVTVLAAWLPARRAAKIPPVAAMSSVHAVATTRSLVVRNSIGGAIALLGAAGVVAGSAMGSDGKVIIAVGAFLALIGVIILIPLLSRPVIALIRPSLTKLFGVSGKLATQNAVRNPRRTGATASALAIGLTLVTSISVLGVTLGGAIDRMTTDYFKADYHVSMASGDSLDESALTALEKADGVAAVSPQQALWLRVGKTDLSGSGVTPGDVEKVLAIETVSGSLGSLGKGEIAVAEKTAKSNGWKTGDSLPVTFEDDKKVNLKVGAVYKENEFLSPVMVPKNIADPHKSVSDIREIYLKMDGGATEANEQAVVDALGDNPAMSIMDRQGIRDMFGGFINTALNLMYGLLAMALIIAVLGVVNTLAMSVFERQQEIGMLRAIGLDRSKVKRMIRLEAVVISLFGAVIGVGLGTFLGWAIGRSLASSIPQYSLVIPWDRLALFLVLAGLVGVLASLWPARSGARLNMLTAIKTE